MMATQRRPVPEKVTFRRLGKTDTDNIRDHYLRLAPEDRRMRFMGLVREETIEKLCERRPWSESVIVGAFVGGELRGVGEMVWSWPVIRATAEIALSVEANFQNTGIGSELLRRLLTTARNRYVERVHMLCLADNRKMQRVAKKFEAELIFQRGEVEGRIWPPMPSYLTVMQEVIDQTEALFNVTFDPSALPERRED